MKFPTFSRTKPAFPDATVSPSGAPTGVHLSKGSSLSDVEKKEVLAGTTTSSQASHHGSQIGDTPVEETKGVDHSSDEPVYPTGVKLAIITASLCISVFCMALVSLRPRYHSIVRILSDCVG